MQRFEAVLSHGGELTMWSEWMVDSWGYGGYGPFHMIVWIILVIATVAGVVWRVVRAQQKKVILNSFCSGTVAGSNSKDIPQFVRLGLDVRVVKRAS